MPLRQRRVPLLRTTVLIVAALAVVTGTTGCGGPSNDKVGIIGDSITDLSRTPLQTALGSDHHIEIVGKFGARSDQVIDDVKVIAASDPAEAVINIGTNDALQQVPVAQTEANIGKILDLLDGADCVFLVQINEGITDVASGASRQAEAKAINDALTSLASKHDGVTVIPWNRDIAEHGGAGAITYDTVHLSEKGLVVLADTYKSALASC